MVRWKASECRKPMKSKNRDFELLLFFPFHTLKSQQILTTWLFEFQSRKRWKFIRVQSTIHSRLQDARYIPRGTQVIYLEMDFYCGTNIYNIETQWLNTSISPNLAVSVRFCFSCIAGNSNNCCLVECFINGIVFIYHGLVSKGLLSNRMPPLLFITIQTAFLPINWHSF